MKNLFSLITITSLCALTFSGHAVSKRTKSAHAKKASPAKKETPAPIKKETPSAVTRETSSQAPKNATDSIREFRIVLLSEVKNQEKPLIVFNVDELFMADMQALPAEMVKEIKDAQEEFPSLSSEEQLATMMKLAVQLIPYQVFVDKRIPEIFAEAFEKGARIVAITCHAPSSADAFLSVLKDRGLSLAESSPVENLVANSNEFSFLYQDGVLFAGHPELLGHALAAFFKSTDLAEHSLILLGSVQNLFEK